MRATRPNSRVKNREDRLVVLNDVAKSIIEAQRGIHDIWVFFYNRKPLAKMNDSAWKRARIKASEQWKSDKGENAHPGLTRIRVHDLKHTFGRRLRVAGVSFEGRQALLGHKSGSVTTDYSAAEIEHLIAQANRVTRRSTQFAESHGVAQEGCMTEGVGDPCEKSRKTPADCSSTKQKFGPSG